MASVRRIVKSGAEMLLAGGRCSWNKQTLQTNSVSVSPSMVVIPFGSW
jgi:hypothetical protein